MARHERPNSSARDLSTPGPAPATASAGSSKAAVGEATSATSGVWLAGALVLVVTATALGTLGGTIGAAMSAGRFLNVMFLGGGLAAMYLVSAVGLGRLGRPLFRNSAEPWAIQVALGLSLQLTLSHLLGVLGLFAGPAGAAASFLPVVAGLGLLLHQAYQSPGVRGWLKGHADGQVSVADLFKIRMSLMQWARLLVLAPGVGVLLVAASNPPGWLWDSEFGGYDALSYHLQLPQEWILAGRVWPLQHNVYSFLPSYMESAFVHLAKLSGASRKFSPSGWGYGLLSGDGWRCLACQWLHAGFGLAAAWLIARLVRRAAIETGFSPRASGTAAWSAAAVFLLVPWTQVVGSLAYNELGVAALFAGAIIAACDQRITPSTRGLIAAWLVGVACGVKPTALMFCAPLVGVMLLAATAPKQWARLAAMAAASGVLALSPWLARNFEASGNPVFPAMTSVFGKAHWSEEQVSRFTSAHQFKGGLADRLRLLVAPEPVPTGPDAQVPDITRYRGLRHPQWSLFPVFLIAGAAGSLAARRTRALGIVLSAGVFLQLAVWMFTTHLQSRFLFPLLVPGAALFGLGVAVLADAAATKASARTSGLHPGGGATATGPVNRPATIPKVGLATGSAAGGPRWASTAAGLLVIAVLAVQAGLAVRVFAGQQRDVDEFGRRTGPGRPNAALMGGPEQFSGAMFRINREIMQPGEWEIARRASPHVYVNLNPPPTPVLLVGESAPFYYTVPIRYATTWDRSPLARVMAEHPGAPETWAGELFGGRLGPVVANFSELQRLRRSGWVDPVLDIPAISSWLNAHAKVVEAWPDRGQVLFRFPASAAPGGASSAPPEPAPVERTPTNPP